MTRLPHVIVVGGGGGGLALGAFLSAAGIPVDIYEQASRLGEVGAGVQVSPNSLRLLDRIGLGDAARAAGAELGPESTYRRTDGTPTSPSPTRDSAGEYSAYGMHRADLIELLRAAVPAERIHTGKRAVRVERDPACATVRFEDGTSATGDIVVGADGIHSILRAQLVGPSTPAFSGTIAYRGLIPADRLPDWPTDRSELWMGDRKHFLVYPVRGGQLINYVGFVPSDDRVKESWSAGGDPDELRAAFAGWDARIERLLSQVDSCFWWGLYDREPLDSWTHDRVTLLGDAAHPMLPHLGQGVNQAIEDAATLTTVLAHHGADGVLTALEQYSAVRRARTSVLQGGSRRTGSRFERSGDEDALDARDAEMREARAFRMWIFDYDAVAEAEAAMALTAS